MKWGGVAIYDLKDSRGRESRQASSCGKTREEPAGRQKGLYKITYKSRADAWLKEDQACVGLERGAPGGLTQLCAIKNCERCNRPPEGDATAWAGSELWEEEQGGTR